MSSSSVEQASFLGGEWSPYAQGRYDQPTYKTGLGTCENALPIEAGAWMRRSGTCEYGISNYMYPGIIREFMLPDGTSATLEFTYNSGSSYARFWQKPLGNAGIELNYVNSDTIVAISTATPAVVQTTDAQTWTTGMSVTISIDSTVAVTNAPMLRNRQFAITKIDTTHFSLKDIFTNANVVGSTLGISSLGTSYINLIQTLALPYTTLAAVKAIKLTQIDNFVYLHCPGYTTQIITMTPTYSAGVLTNTQFALTGVNYGITDGPYLDPPLYPNGTSQTGCSLAYVVKGADWNHLTFAITDGGYSLSAGDVGKGIRLWSQPPPWQNNFSSCKYGVGNVVTYNNEFWSSAVSFASMVGAVAPGSTGADTKGVVWQAWAPAPTSGQWIWGYIATVSSSTTATIVITSATSVQTLLGLNGSFEPRNSAYYTDGGITTASTTGAMIDTYQIGAFGDSVYPTCGALYEGRLWLGGAIPNRIDASTNGNTIDTALGFSPTDLYGSVLDTSGIDYAISGMGQANIQWIVPDVQGLILSTLGGEFLVAASALNDPITATSIQIHPCTKYLASPVQPIHVGQNEIFIQKEGEKVFEYLYGAAFSAHKFVGKHINEFAKHLTSTGVNDLAYTEEKAPVIWTYNNLGTLLGCTYRRISVFPTEPALFTGWHRHSLGSNRSVISLCHGAGPVDALESVVLMTKDSNGYCYVEQLTNLFDENYTLLNAWYVDASPPPNAGIAGSDQGTSSITLWGLWTASTNSKKVSVWLGGLDCGDYSVQSDGSVIVPYGSDPDGILTAAYLHSITGANAYGSLGAQVDVTIASSLTRVVVPCVIGYNYTSAGETLRALDAQDVKSPEGPSLGKTRRTHNIAALFQNTVGGTNGIQFRSGALTTYYPALFTYEGQAPYTYNYETMFNGVFWTTVDSNYDFDGVVSWQTQRPYPCVICAISGFQETAER